MLDHHCCICWTNNVTSCERTVAALIYLPAFHVMMWLKKCSQSNPPSSENVAM